MKKKLFLVMIIAVIGSFVGYNKYQNQQTIPMSDFALANVEALAAGESGATWYCCGNYGDCIIIIAGDGYHTVKGIKFFSPC